MTHQYFIRISFLAFVCTCSLATLQTVSAASKTITVEQNTAMVLPVSPDNSGTDLPDAGLKDKAAKADTHKSHLQKIDELGKIHRFHKERVRKTRKHPGKLWVTAMLVIVGCHIALLIHAFIHMVH